MKKILIAAPVHQTQEIFGAYCTSLSRLDTKNGDFEVHIMFGLHNCEDNIKKTCNRYGFGYFEENDSVEYEYDVENGTHKWGMKNFNKVVRIKHQIIKFAKLHEFDKIFWVDSDILLHPKTLKHLIEVQLASGSKIASQIFWTRWNETDLYPTPNCWDFDQYGFNENFLKFKKPGVYEVGGTGAAILVDTNVYNEYVNYNPIKNISFSYWEDRAFCIRAAVMGHKIMASSMYPAYHIYRPENLVGVPEFFKECEQK